MTAPLNLPFLHPHTGRPSSPDDLIAEAIESGEIRRRGDVIDLLLDNLDYLEIKDEGTAMAEIRAWVAGREFSLAIGGGA